MKRMTLAAAAIWMTLALASSRAVGGVEVESRIQTLLSVEKEGAGHAAAVPIIKELTQQPATALLPLLEGMDEANPLAANWLRGAFEAIADRNLQAGAPLPAKELEAFVQDRSHAAQSRQLAFDWLLKIDPAASDRLVPQMLDDPSAEFRRAGVERVLAAAAAAAAPTESGEGAAKSKDLYQQAFQAALDPDQLDQAYDELIKLGEKPDLKRQLGLLSHWQLIGPFDHRNGIGFDVAYPPEAEIELTEKYAGTTSEVSWVDKTTDERHAVVDLNTLLGRHKGAIAYAYCEFEADHAQTAEIRLGTPNGWKLWVNGKPVFAHEEYHQLTRMDQYRTPVMLEAGTNRILLKICQNEQTQDWAQDWQFQVRICDGAGNAVLPVDPIPATSPAKSVSFVP